MFPRLNGPATAGTTTRQPERLALIARREIHLALLPVRLRTRASGDRRRTDLRPRGTGALRGLRFAAQRDTLQDTRDPRRRRDRDPREVLFAIMARERHRERAERTRGRRDRARTEPRAERQTRRAGATLAIPVHVERTGGQGIRGDRGTPRRHIARDCSPCRTPGGSPTAPLARCSFRRPRH